MLNSHLVNVTSLAQFHSLVKDMVQIKHGHGGKLKRLTGENLKYVDIVKFTKLIEALVEAFITFVGPSQVLNISSESLQDILIMITPYGGVKDGGHGGVVVVTMVSLHKSKDFTAMFAIKIHQRVILLDAGQILLMSPQPL